MTYLGSSFGFRVLWPKKRQGVGIQEDSQLMTFYTYILLQPSPNMST